MNRLFIAGLSLACALVAGPTFAEHDLGRPGGGPVYQLQQQSQYLDQLVRYHRLAYAVQQAVSRFVGDVAQLSYCGGPGFGGPVITPIPPHHGGPIIVNPGPGRPCGFERDRVRQSFYQVDRYLNGIAYQYPQVHQQYLVVRRLVNQLGNVGPGPGPGPVPGPGYESYSCVAVDNGWEEHGGGHRAYARNIQQAQRQALRECQRFHGACRIQRCDRVN